MVEFELPKLATRVRFPSPAPYLYQWRRIGSPLFSPLARDFFQALSIGVIIFLTGCAPRGYHTSSAAPPGASIQGFPRSAPSGQLLPFAWPLKGQVIVPFGAKENGISSKGIVIKSTEGSLVVAAKDGRVKFVDEALRGYGKTVILEHLDGFSTVYARNSEILVKLGQGVHQGEPIAKVGRAGAGSFPQLYFEIRNKSKAEDPDLYLG